MRKTYNMDFDWKFIKQNKNLDAGIEDYFGMFDNNTKTGVTSGPKSASFYDGDWETVDLPHDWSLGEPASENGNQGHGYKAQGTVWYRKSFIADKDFFGKRVFLKFEGIAIESEIYLNDVKIAVCESGYTPITIEITDFLVYGGYNVISVKCSNSVKEGWWYEGGGVYRHTYLIVTEESCFEDNGVFVKPEKTGENIWSVSVIADILNPEGCSVETEFEGKTYTDSFTVSSPELWSIENPKLYTLTVKLIKNNTVVDEQTVNFGFREILFDKDKGFFLNGKSVKLKGFCQHHDHACVGVAVPFDVMLYRLRKLKDMGCNAIRTSHNPKSPDFYDLCDRLGILVMNEARHFSSSKEVLWQLSEFIKRDRNHPSVIMWSIYNEEPLQDTVSGELIAKRMKELINKLDGTRPVTGAMNGGPFGGEGVIKSVDVFGMNYLQYTYDDFHKTFPDIPLFGSENASYLTTRGVNETDDMHYSCTGQELYVNLFKWSANPGDTWRMAEERDFVAGIFSWTGFDYRGESNRWPAIACNFGALDLCGFYKNTGYWYKSLWSKDPFIAIAPRWDFAIGEKANIGFYSNAEEIDVYLNDELIDSFKNDKYSPTVLTLDFVPGTLKAVGKISGCEVCSAVKVTPGDACEISVNLSDDYITADRQSSVVADVCLKDADGNVLDNISDEVTFEISGGGRILGVGNGDVTSHHKETGNVVNLFYGYCQTVIMSDGTENDIKLAISCKGIKKEIIIPVKKPDAPVNYIPSVSCKIPLNQWRRSDVTDYYPDGLISDMGFAWIPQNISLGNPFVSSDDNGHCLVAIRYFLKCDYKPNTFVNLNGVLGNADVYINDVCVAKGTCGDLRFELAPENFGTPGCVSIVFNTNGEKYGVTGETIISFE